MECPCATHPIVSPFGVYSARLFFNTVAIGLLDIDSSKICCTFLCFKCKTPKRDSTNSSNFSCQICEPKSWFCSIFWCCAFASGIATFEVGNSVPKGETVKRCGIRLQGVGLYGSVVWCFSFQLGWALGDLSWKVWWKFRCFFKVAKIP